MAEKPATKICKYCKTEIAYDAKMCPHCRKRQRRKGSSLVIPVILGLIVIAMISKGSNSTSSTGVVSEKGSTTKSAKVETTAEVIEYTAYSVTDMMNDLKANALNASDKYKGKYVEITGKLSTIDSSGKYISLLPDDGSIAFIGVQCYLKKDEQKSKVASMTAEQTVTLRGKITNVGEVLGYSLDITEIN